jgi:iron complex outermembrane receptor protein
MKKFSLITLTFITPVALAHIDTNLEAIEVFDHSEDQTLVDFIPSVTTLRGRELQKRRQTSIGDTLQQEAGVNSTSFGPNAGRPVIRGLDGDRVRVLQNSLGTLDASTQSLDHAIPVDTLTIEQIEVVRGPMSLLYGSSAVGGVVNLVTNRIHTMYEEGFFSQAMVQGETVNNGLSSALHLNYGKNKWMFHADGSTRNLQNQELPSHVRGGESERKGELPNSYNQQDNVAVGVSKILDRGHFGVSFNHFRTNYGTVAEEEVSIDMIQNRFEFHGEYRPEGWMVRKIKLRSAQSEYSHKEIEEGATVTTFENTGNETRLEAMTKSENMEGVFGIQTQIFDFSAEGEEAFLPKNANEKYALFSFHELMINPKNFLSFGARVENTEVEKTSGDKDSRDFASYNASLGHQYKFNTKNSISSSISYTERAPNFQELYAEGLHVATDAFEVGDNELVKEKATALEVSFKSQDDDHRLVASVYSQVFKDYISLNPTGVNDVDSGSEIFRFEQVDALFYGFDLDAQKDLLQYNKGRFIGFSKLDWVRAKNTDTGHNLPRISPPRATLGLEYARDTWTSDIEFQYVAHQTKTAPEESSTDSFTLTNIGYAYNVVGDAWALNLFARVRNVFDVEARNHVSFLKEIAPMPGRNFILGAQIQL